MQIKAIFWILSFFIVFSHSLSAQTAENDIHFIEVETEVEDTLPPSTVDIRNPQQLEIAEITVSGAEHWEDFVIIGFSGLSVGQTITVPGDEITNVMRRFMRQGLFHNVQIGYTRIEDGKIWLHIALQERPRISEVNFHGLRRSEIENIEPRLGLVPGNQITPNLSDRAELVARRLLAERGFANAEVRVLQRNDPVRPGYVIVDVEVDKNERTRVHSVNLTGNYHLSEHQINRAMRRTNAPTWINLFRTNRFVQEEFQNDMRALIERYNEFGFRDARIVSYSVVPHDERSVRVYLEIDEGQRYYFRNITWVGNTEYSHELLTELLGIRRGDVFNHTRLIERLFSDHDAVMSLYNNRGFLFAHIEPVEIAIVGDSIDFEMRVFEGRPATINQVNIIGNERVYEHVIRRELHVRPGQLYSQANVIRTLRELAMMGHFDQEQLFADFQQGGIVPNPEDGTVDLNFVLQTRGSDQIEFSLGWGATGVVGSVGLRFTNFAIQNIFRPEMYRIVPQGEGQIFSISAQTNARFFHSVSLQFVEPWLGGRRPNSLSVTAFYTSQSSISDRWNQFYAQQWAMMGGMGMGMPGMGMGGAHMFEIDPERYMRTLGLAVGHGRRLSWPDNFFSFFGEASYQLFMMQDWGRILFPLGNGSYHNISLNMRLGRSSIDSPIFTRRGSAFELGLQVTPPYSLIRRWTGRSTTDYASFYERDPITGANRVEELYQRYNFLEYHKWSFRARTFTPLSPNERLVLMARTEFGFLGHFNQHLRSPIGTFLMGGDGMSTFRNHGQDLISMRGYTSGSLTPTDPMWGSAVAFLYNKFTFELRYAISLEHAATIWALGFVEAGNSFTSFRHYNPFELRRSAGVGVRIFLPMFGIMGIDWAFGFDPDNIRPGQRSGSQFHFVLGTEL